MTKECTPYSSVTVGSRLTHLSSNVKREWYTYGTGMAIVLYDWAGLAATWS